MSENEDPIPLFSQSPWDIEPERPGKKVDPPPRKANGTIFDVGESRVPAVVPSYSLVPYAAAPRPTDDDMDFSCDVQEIMARPPHWLLRWGITIVALIIGTVIFLTWLIRYPDLITGTMSLTGINPAVEVVAHQNGHIAELLVTENQEVAAGQILAILESPAKAERVFAAKKSLTGLIPFLSDPAAFRPIDATSETELGRLQIAYSRFYSDYLAYRAYLADNYTEKTVQLLDRQIGEKKSQIAFVAAQIENSDRSIQLTADRFERMRKLFERGSISKSELEENERELLSAQRSHADLQKELNAEKSRELDIDKQLRDLVYVRTQTGREKTSALQESLERIISEIEIWENENILRAPLDGNVAFYDVWTDRQYVTAGSQVFIIAPKSTSLFGRLMVKGNGVGKIEKGQIVNVKFTDYAYKEFGMVTGRVRSVSLVAREGQHLVLVDIAYPLVTNFGKEIPFRQSMQAEASIITENLRLLDRIFYQIRNAIMSARQT